MLPIEINEEIVTMLLMKQLENSIMLSSDVSIGGFYIFFTFQWSDKEQFALLHFPSFPSNLWIYSSVQLTTKLQRNLPLVFVPLCTGDVNIGNTKNISVPLLWKLALILTALESNKIEIF